MQHHQQQQKQMQQENFECRTQTQHLQATQHQVGVAPVSGVPERNKESGLGNHCTLLQTAVLYT